MRKFAVERLAAFRLSFHRGRGIIRSFERMLDAGVSDPPWWLATVERGDRLRALVAHLRTGFTLEALHAAEQRLEQQLCDPGFEAFFEAIGPVLGGVPAARGPAWEAWIDGTRIARARELCARFLGAAIDEVLGTGSEGVVLRAGDRVLKVFDRWSATDRAAHLGKLHHLRLHPCTPALPRILGVHEAPEAVVLETAYEPSQPCQGGEGAHLVTLLRTLRAGGWVHTNVHPKNLRVTARGLTLIDLGRSLEPATPAGEERMARRSLLACRFASRSDLAALMRRSIDDHDFPELVGWEHLLEAVRAGSVKQLLDAELARLVHAIDPRHLLDFGCGKPRSMPALAEGVRWPSSIRTRRSADAGPRPRRTSRSWTSRPSSNASSAHRPSI